MKKKHRIPAEARKAERALRIAVAKAIEEHRQTGDPIVVWKNGKVVDIPADKLSALKAPSWLRDPKGRRRSRPSRIPGHF